VMFETLQLPWGAPAEQSVHSAGKQSPYFAGQHAMQNQMRAAKQQQRRMRGLKPKTRQPQRMRQR